ncbi:hypothetical protein J4206_05155 [Candidatus Woesearchaeota archaeon]|nr:hypothetical protein [Candidatus Woesearchaeota archaeon]
MRSVKRVLLNKIINRINTTNYKPVVLNSSKCINLPDGISRVNQNGL